MKVSKAAPSSCTLMLGLGLLALLPLVRDDALDLVPVAIFLVLLGSYSFFHRFHRKLVPRMFHWLLDALVLAKQCMLV